MKPQWANAHIWLIFNILINNLGGQWATSLSLFQSTIQANFQVERLQIMGFNKLFNSDIKFIKKSSYPFSFYYYSRHAGKSSNIIIE